MKSQCYVYECYANGDSSKMLLHETIGPFDSAQPAIEFAEDCRSRELAAGYIGEVPQFEVRNLNNVLVYRTSGDNVELVSALCGHVVSSKDIEDSGVRRNCAAEWYIRMDSDWFNTKHYIGPFASKAGATVWLKSLHPDANVWSKSSVCTGDIRSAWRCSKPIAKAYLRDCLTADNVISHLELPNSGPISAVVRQSR